MMKKTKEMKLVKIRSHSPPLVDNDEKMINETVMLYLTILGNDDTLEKIEQKACCMQRTLRS